MSLPADGLGPPLTLTPLEPPGPTKTRRARKPKPKAADHWPPTPARLAALVVVLDALGQAREAAGFAKPHRAPSRLRQALEEGVRPPATDEARQLLARLVELEQDEDRAGTLELARDLLAATMRAKVAEHAKSDDDRFRSGSLATPTTLCRRCNFDSWIAAGLAWQARQAGKVRTTGPPDEIDGIPLTSDEGKIWAEWRRTSLAEADKRVRWDRIERKAAQ